MNLSSFCIEYRPGFTLAVLKLIHFVKFIFFPSLSEVLGDSRQKSIQEST